MLSISMPSTIKRGLEPSLLIVEAPRIRKVEAAPGSEEERISRPGTLPCKAVAKVVGALFISSAAPTDEIAPVISRFLIVP